MTHSKINNQTSNPILLIKHPTGHSSYCLGSTLIEVLITMVILSIGVLAATVMFAESIATLGNLVHQQRAIRLAANISEVLKNIPHNRLINPPTPKKIECSRQYICTPGEWLATNLYNWQQLAYQQLPDGHIAIDSNNTSNGSSTKTNILITWSHQNGQKLKYALQLETV